MRRNGKTMAIQATTCGHLPHFAKGFCKRCYDLDYKAKRREELRVKAIDYRARNIERERARDRARAPIRQADPAYRAKKNESRRRWRTPTYRVWEGLASRCYNSNDTAFAYYGGRGITVCDRWRGKGGFANFVADMGERPDGMSLDRIDNNGPYSPENCQWATWSQQMRNRRTKHQIQTSR